MQGREPGNKTRTPRLPFWSNRNVVDSFVNLEIKILSSLSFFMYKKGGIWGWKHKEQAHIFSLFLYHDKQAQYRTTSSWRAPRRRYYEFTECGLFFLSVIISCHFTDDRTQAVRIVAVFPIFWGFDCRSWCLSESRSRSHRNRTRLGHWHGGSLYEAHGKSNVFSGCNPILIFWLADR